MESLESPVLSPQEDVISKEDDERFREQLVDQMDRCSTEWSVIEEEPNLSAPNTLTPLVEERLLARKAVTLMPWEIEGWNFIFGGVDDDVEIGGFSEVGIYDALSLHVKESAGEPAHSQFAKRRLRIAHLVQCEDHLRWMALLKFRNLVLAEPSVTALGQSLLDKSGRMMMESDISATFRDVFSGKATATLAKRASALWRYGQWIAKNGLGNPLSYTEEKVYRYVQHLDGGPATSADSFLQAVRFSIHLLGVRGVTMDAIISARVKGCAGRQFASKRPLKQAIPLSRQMVEALEKEAATGDVRDYITLVAGQLAFCLHACSRFSDSLHIEELTVSTYGNICLVETSTRKHKTATTKEKKSRFLPMSCLGIGLGLLNWAANWVKARDFWGIDVRSGTALPAYSEVDCKLITRPLTTGEATLYLREILTNQGCPSAEVESVTTHSLKVTILTWAAQSCRISFQDRMLMGHHIPKGDMSVLVYSREEMIRLLAQTHGLLQLIRDGVLDPDRPRVRKLAKLLKRKRDESVSESSAESSSESSDSSDEDCDVEDCVVDERACMGLSAQEPPAEMLDVSSLRIHKLSGVAHSLDGDDKFACGRKLTANYMELDPTWELQTLPVCLQCQRSFWNSGNV